MNRKLLFSLLLLLLVFSLCACGSAENGQALSLPADDAHHSAYTCLAADGVFRPNDLLTRREAAQMLGELTGAHEGTAAFSDVEAASVGSGEIAALAGAGVLRGYSDGLFRPDSAMTRAELVYALYTLSDIPSATASFEDVPVDHWAAEALGAAQAAGWITGYADGSFYPDASITRAEAVTIINRALGRRADRSVSAPEVGCYIVTDVSPLHWAYYDILEASLDHDYVYSDSPFEHWSAYELKLIAPQAGAQYLNGVICYADSETHELALLSEGWNDFGDALLYASEAGYAADYFDPGPVEFQNALYCVDENGSFITDGDWGHLHFGADGRYSSGSETVDAYVEEYLIDILHDDSMTQEEKLYAAYCVIRDGGFTYSTRGDTYDRGTSYWTLECAEKFYKSKKGTCYYFTSGFLYFARRLGYDARAVAGGVWSNNAYHTWVVITETDGEQYIFDVELEWAYMHGYYSDTPKHYNLFKQPIDNALFIYNFPDVEESEVNTVS